MQLTKVQLKSATEGSVQRTGIWSRIAADKEKVFYNANGFHDYAAYGSRTVSVQQRDTLYF